VAPTGEAIVRFAVLIAAALIAICGFGGIATANDIPAHAVQNPWKKYCRNNQTTGFKRICSTRAEARNSTDDSLLAAIDVVEPADHATKGVLRVTFPLGMQLKSGTRLIVDGSDSQQSPYVICTAAGCSSDYEATPGLIASMRAARRLFVQSIDRSGKPLNVALSLDHFWAAYDSPRAEMLAPEPESFRIPEARSKPWLDDTLRRELRPR
jgi:invasion protein IalB